MRRFVIYALIGVTGLTLDLVAFALLHLQWGLDKQLASWLSISLAITLNFILNARYNFRVRDRLLRRYVSFYLVGTSGILLTAVILWLLVDQLGTGPMVAKLVSLPLVLVTQFTLNSLVSFRAAGGVVQESSR